MVQQDVAAAHDLEDLGGVAGLDLAQLCGGHGDERRVEQLGPIEPGNGEETGEVERPGDCDDLVAVDVELFDEQLEHVRVDRLLDLEAHWRAEASARQLALEGFQQVLCLVLLDLDVLVASDPERVALENLHAGEEGVEVGGDDVLERDEALAAVEWDEAWQGRRHLDAGEVLLLGVRVAHDDGKVE